MTTDAGRLDRCNLWQTYAEPEGLKACLAVPALLIIVVITWALLLRA